MFVRVDVEFFSRDDYAFRRGMVIACKIKHLQRFRFECDDDITVVISKSSFTFCFLFCFFVAFSDASGSADYDKDTL